MVGGPVQGRGDGHDNGHGQAHAGGGLELSGQRDQRADTEEISERNVVRQDRRHEHDQRMGGYGHGQDSSGRSLAVVRKIHR